MSERVGFLGLGIMGSRMATCLRRAGHDGTVWNRTRATADAWVGEHVGRAAATPSEAADGATAGITIVVDGPQVEEILLGADGAAACAAPGSLFVDMSTIAPAYARRICATLAQRGHHFMDAPVTGSSPRAETGTLTIMAGGEARDFARA